MSPADGGRDTLSSMDTDIRGHLTVTGVVQGVGYRVFAHRAATQLHLRGWVRNLWNGDVEIVTEGPRRMIDAFIQQLRHGPAHAEVDDVRMRWEAATGEFTGFTIRR